MGKSTTGLAACVLFLALMACKDDKPEPSAETPAAPSAAAANTAEPTAAPSATPEAAASTRKINFKVGDVPDIPSERSDPPKGTEWDSAPIVNTQGANARAARCSMRVLREWLRIYCTGDIIGYEKMEDFGKLQVDYFEKIVAGKYASFVIRLKKGKNPKIRICRKKDRASLFVSWPPSVDKPKHVALGNGPVCDGSDWGVGYGKPGGAAAKAPDVDPEAESLIEMQIYSRQAEIQCVNGDKDACMFACGSPTCGGE
ncbi:MAG: hypothetical protein R3B07_00255 [Polyangiaceae bacterium]